MQTTKEAHANDSIVSQFRRDSPPCMLHESLRLVAAQISLLTVSSANLTVPAVLWENEADIMPFPVH